MYVSKPQVLSFFREFCTKISGKFQNIFWKIALFSKIQGDSVFFDAEGKTVSGIKLTCGVAGLLLMLVVMGSAQAGLIDFDGHFYGLTDSAGAWQDAENEAMAMGGHLVAINSAAENQFLSDTFLDDEPDKKLRVDFVDLNFDLMRNKKRLQADIYRILNNKQTMEV